MIHKEQQTGTINTEKLQIEIISESIIIIITHQPASLYLNPLSSLSPRTRVYTFDKNVLQGTES